MGNKGGILGIALDKKKAEDTGRTVTPSPGRRLTAARFAMRFA